MKENPHDMELAFQKSNLLFNLGKLDECLKTCDICISSGFSDQRISCLKVKSLIGLKDFKSALVAVEDLLKINSEPNSFRLKCEIFHYLGLHEEALAVYKNHLANYMNGDDILKVVDIYSEIGNYEKALDFCNAFISIYGTNINSILKKASLLSLLVESQESFSYYELATKELVKAGFNNLSLEKFDTILEINPEDSGALFYRGVLRDMNEYHNGAFSDYKEATDLLLKYRLYEDAINAYFVAKKISLNSSALEKANNIFLSKIESSNDEALRSFKADIFYQKGISFSNNNTEKALKSFSMAYDIFIEDHDYEKALDVAKKAIKTNPSIPGLWSNKAYCERELRYFDESISSYKQAASIWEKMKEYDKVIRIYSKLINYDYCDPLIYCSRARMYELIFKSDKALNDYEIALNLWIEKNDLNNINFCKNKIDTLGNKNIRSTETCTLVLVKGECSKQRPKTMNIFKLANEAENGTSFEEFYDEVLSSVSKIQGLARADDELMIYTLFKNTGLFVPTLKYSGTGYVKEYSELNNYFLKLFFELLKERVESTNGIKLNNDKYKDLKNDFTQFRASVDENMLELHDGCYVGISEVNPALIFFKKILPKN